MTNTDTIVRVFNEINNGEISNAVFSDANVVMISRDMYSRLQDAWVHYTENKYCVTTSTKNEYWVPVDQYQLLMIEMETIGESAWEEKYDCYQF